MILHMADLEVGLLNMTVTVCEGDPEGDSDGDVCIGLSDVPADGIACDVVVTLSLIQDTASKESLMDVTIKIINQQSTP